MPVSDRPRKKRRKPFDPVINTASLPQMWQHMLLMHVGHTSPQVVKALKGLAAIVLAAGRLNDDEKLIEAATTAYELISSGMPLTLATYPLASSLGAKYAQRKVGRDVEKTAISIAEMWSKKGDDGYDRFFKEFGARRGG